jgi:predicted protein tyrosine phosphatase
MKVLIRNRETIEECHFSKNTALISITDVGYEFAELKNKPGELLQLKFDDVDFDEPINIITNKQAKEIAEFYHRVSKTAKIIICQCEHGQGKSAAIAAAIKEYTEGNGIEIFANYRYYPNKVVFRKVLKALKVNERN